RTTRSRRWRSLPVRHPVMMLRNAAAHGIIITIVLRLGLPKSQLRGDTHMGTPAQPANDVALAATLHARGRRATSQRLVLHRALLELNRHATADELLRATVERLPQLSLPTVYATLELFEELGLGR